MTLQDFIPRNALLLEVVHIFKGNQELLTVSPLCSKPKVRDDLARLPLGVDKQGQLTMLSIHASCFRSL